MVDLKGDSFELKALKKKKKRKLQKKILVVFIQPPSRGGVLFTRPNIFRSHWAWRIYSEIHVSGRLSLHTLNLKFIWPLI